MATELHAILPHPVGINGTYRIGRRPNGQPVLYKSARASSWQDDALLYLRRAGFRRLPPGHYFVALHCGLFTKRLDLDAPLKLLIDTVAEALGINDRDVGALTATKIHGPRGSEERIELKALVIPMTSPTEWNALAADGWEAAS